MPIIKSAKKRVKVARKAAIRNRKTRRTLKTALQNFHKSLTEKDKNKVSKSHASAQSAIGKATKKKVIHKNKAARKQKQLAAKAKALGSPQKTTAVKKSATKKTTTKKTSPKKAVSKKTTKK